MTKVVIVSMGSSWTCLEQFAPLYWLRKQLALDLAVGLRTVWVDPWQMRLPKWIREADVVLLQVNHFVDQQLGLDLIDRIRSDCPQAKLCYYDGDDDAGVAWPAAVQASDLYVKQQLYRDRSWYQRQFLGKSNLTDYVARHHGIGFANDPFPQNQLLPAQCLPKLWLGWNIACSKAVQMFRSNASCDGRKTTDAVLLATVPSGWIHPLRQPAVDALRKLAGRYSVVVPDHRVDYQAYCRWMCASRICVSPFGNGEVCFRDFEAILAGCLLVKPDMSHLETQPDVYLPNETYVPVRWDFADLGEVVERHLRDDSLRESIVRRAREVLDRFVLGGGVVDNVRRQLEALSVSIG